MKIWLKYLIGIVLGVLSALILPFGSLQGVSTLSFVTEFVIRI
jgi:Na+/H+-dicarboxylate symporter